MPTPVTIHPDCREFVEVVEDLLNRRQNNLSNHISTRAWQDNLWGPRTWTRTEMEDMVYSSYKQMRRGRITRPPRREVVIDMADYLDCTIDERNRLLVAANLPPVDPYLTYAYLFSLLLRLQRRQSTAR